MDGPGPWMARHHQIAGVGSSDKCRAGGRRSGTAEGLRHALLANPAPQGLWSRPPVRRTRPAGPSSLAAYQTRRASVSFGSGPLVSGPAPDDGLDFALRHTRSEKARPDSGPAVPMARRE